MVELSRKNSRAGVKIIFGVRAPIASGDPTGDPCATMQNPAIPSRSMETLDLGVRMLAIKREVPIWICKRAVIVASSKTIPKF